jgi:hypothetical protein
MGFASRTTYASLRVHAESYRCLVTLHRHPNDAYGDIEATSGFLACRYCELKKELGEWERAIALAPAVSLELWAQLAKEYANMLLAKNPSRLHDLLPWFVGIHQADTLVNLYINAEQYDDAVTLAQVLALRPPPPLGARFGPGFGKPPPRKQRQGSSKIGS